MSDWHKLNNTEDSSFNEIMPICKKCHKAQSISVSKSKYCVTCYKEMITNVVINHSPVRSDYKDFSGI